jgi:hypothetical protein
LGCELLVRMHYFRGLVKVSEGIVKLASIHVNYAAIKVEIFAVKDVLLVEILVVCFVLV